MHINKGPRLLFIREKEQRHALDSKPLPLEIYKIRQSNSSKKAKITLPPLSVLKDD